MHAHMGCGVQVRKSAVSTLEIRSLLRDLQVLGRTEFKALLRWWVLGPR